MNKKGFSQAECEEIRDRINKLMPDGMTQTALANASGVKQPSLSSIMNASSPEIKAVTIVGLAKALNCSTDYLLLRSNIPNAKTMTDDEQTVLAGFRLLGAELRKNWMDTARSYIENAKATKNKAA